MGIEPHVCHSQGLRLAGLRLEQTDVIELSEAFATQSLTVMVHSETDIYTEYVDPKRDE